MQLIKHENLNNMIKLTEGQKVFLKPINNAARRNKEIRKAIVISVGKKYFTLQDATNLLTFRNKFSLNTMQEHSPYSPDYEVYLCEKKLQDELSRPVVMKQILDKLQTKSVDQLKEISMLIDLRTR